MQVKYHHLLFFPWVVSSSSFLAFLCTLCGVLLLDRLYSLKHWYYIYQRFEALYSIDALVSNMIALIAFSGQLVRLCLAILNSNSPGRLCHQSIDNLLTNALVTNMIALIAFSDQLVRLFLAIMNSSSPGQFNSKFSIDRFKIFIGKKEIHEMITWNN